MLKVALTGGIATGKSHVLEELRRRGIPCLDADALAHGATAAGTESTRAITERFGSDVLAADGAVDRQKLAVVVFADDQARRDLEAIVHPAVYRAISAGLRAFESMGDPLAVVDVPLLYETGHEGDFDRVIATTCAVDVQMRRLLHRGMSEQEARARLAAQWASADKAARADFVIETSGTVEETSRQLDEILRRLVTRQASTSSAS
jgi:dephospho-CoA kinase